MKDKDTHNEKHETMKKTKTLDEMLAESKRNSQICEEVDLKFKYGKIDYDEAKERLSEIGKNDPTIDAHLSRIQNEKKDMVELEILKKIEEGTYFENKFSAKHNIKG